MRISDWSSDVCSSDLVRHSGGLAADDKYDVALDLAVPNDLGTEAYDVVVVTDPARYDATGALFEADERDNIRGTIDPMVIELPPPTDIEVRDIVIPGDRQSGDPVTVSWTVRNISDVIASGSWTDAVYLSRDATWDVGDKLLGRADFSVTLLPDRSEEHTSELQSLMRISYAVCCLKKKKNQDTH